MNFKQFQRPIKFLLNSSLSHATTMKRKNRVELAPVDCFPSALNCFDSVLMRLHFFTSVQLIENARIFTYNPIFFAITTSVSIIYKSPSASLSHTTVTNQVTTTGNHSYLITKRKKTAHTNSKFDGI